MELSKHEIVEDTPIEAKHSSDIKKKDFDAVSTISGQTKLDINAVYAASSSSHNNNRNSYHSNILTPVAVPVVTQEEAEKLNENALSSDFEIISLFEESIKTESVIRAKVEEISKPIESIAKMDYPNCFISCIVSCLGIIYGNNNIPQRIIVYLPEIQNKNRIGTLPQNNEIMDIKIVPYSKLSNQLQEIQRNDTLLELDLDEYAGIVLPPNNYVIRSFPKMTSSVQEKHVDTLPRSDEEIKIRNKQLQEDLMQSKNEYNKLKSHLVELNEFVKTNLISEANKADDGAYIINNDGMTFAVYDGVNPFENKTNELANGIESLRALENYLDLYDIDLIIIPVPEKKSFNYVMAFDTTKEYKSAEYIRIVYDLRQEGFEIIDIWSGVQNHILPCNTPFNLSNYYPKDIAQIGGYLLAERLKRYNYNKKEDFFLDQDNKVKRNKNQPLNGVHPSYVSPFFTIGNSFGYNPSEGSIRHFGSYYAGIEIDNHNVGDGHKYFGRLLLRNPSFLERKKAYILIVQTGHLNLLENIEKLRNLNALYPYMISFDSPTSINEICSPHLQNNSKDNALTIVIPDENIDQPEEYLISIPPEFQKLPGKYLLRLEFAMEDQKKLPSVYFKIGNQYDVSQTDVVSIPFSSNDIINNHIPLLVSARSKCFIEIKTLSIMRQ